LRLHQAANQTGNAQHASGDDDPGDYNNQRVAEEAPPGATGARPGRRGGRRRNSPAERAHRWRDRGAFVGRGGSTTRQARPLAHPVRGLPALQLAQQQLQVQPQEARIVAQEALRLDGRHAGVVAQFQCLQVLEANTSPLLNIGQGQLFGFAGLAQTLAQSLCIAHAGILPDR